MLSNQGGKEQVPWNYDKYQALHLPGKGKTLNSLYDYAINVIYVINMKNDYRSLLLAESRPLL